MPEEEHFHKWNLSSPVDGVSTGTCYCGEVKDFGGSGANYNFTHSRHLSPSKMIKPEMGRPSSKLLGIFEKMLGGMSNNDIAKSLRLNVNGLIRERTRGLQSMGVSGSGQSSVLQSILYSVENGYIKVPTIEGVHLEDTEKIVLDMLTENPADSVANEIGIPVKNFESILAPTYEKLGVNNSLAAAAVWFGNGLEEKGINN